MLTDQHLKILQAATTSIWLGNFSAPHGLDIMRLSGARLAEDNFHLHLFVPEKYTGRFLKNVAEEKKVTNLFSCVYTFIAFQIKGIYIEHRKCTQEENQFQKTYLDGFGKTMSSIGLTSGKSFGQYWEEPALCFTIRPQEIFEQTPRPGTGNKVG